MSYIEFSLLCLEPLRALKASKLGLFVVVLSHLLVGRLLAVISSKSKVCWGLPPKEYHVIADLFKLFH